MSAGATGQVPHSSPLCSSGLFSPRRTNVHPAQRIVELGTSSLEHTLPLIRKPRMSGAPGKSSGRAGQLATSIALAVGDAILVTGRVHPIVTTGAARFPACCDDAGIVPSPDAASPASPAQCADALAVAVWVTAADVVTSMHGPTRRHCRPYPRSRASRTDACAIVGFAASRDAIIGSKSR